MIRSIGNPFSHPSFGPTAGIGGTAPRPVNNLQFGTMSPYDNSGTPNMPFNPIYGSPVRKLPTQPAVSGQISQVNPYTPGVLDGPNMQVNRNPAQVLRSNMPNQMIAGGGVRPGVYNGPNAVQAAGGSYVPPNMAGRNPNDPRNAALAPYPGMGGGYSGGAMGGPGGVGGFAGNGINPGPGAGSPSANANHQNMVASQRGQ